MRLGDMEHERAIVIAIDPHDVVVTRFVHPAVDRVARGGDIGHRGRQLGQLVFIASQPREALGAEADARERIGEPLAGELDGKPAVVARAQSRGNANSVLGGPGRRRKQPRE